MTTYRIPPSLGWLIRSRRTIMGRIALAERQMTSLRPHASKAKAIVDKVEQLPKLIATLKVDLETTDRMIRMHEIPVNPDNINGLRVQTSVKNQPHGAMTRAIYGCLAVEPLRWKTTTEIAIFVANECYPGITDNEFPRYRWDVRHRMRALAQHGKIDRAKFGNSYDEGLWRQKSTPESREPTPTYSRARLSVDSLENSLETIETDQPDKYA